MLAGSAASTVTAGGNLGTALCDAGRRLAPRVASTSSRSAASSSRPPTRSIRGLRCCSTSRPIISIGTRRSRSTRRPRRASSRTRRPTTGRSINADDPASLALARGIRARRFDFALDARLADGVTVAGRRHRPARPRARRCRCCRCPSVRLPGRHLLADVLAAAAVGCVAGVPPAAMRRAVEGFPGLEHALEPVAEIGGVRFVNDSKATNIASARRVARELRRGRGRDHGRPVQGRPLRGPARRRRGARRRDRRHRRGRAARSRRRWAISCRSGTRASMAEAVRRARSAWPPPAASCCSRRRARASTCSRTTPTRGGRSRTRCGAARTTGKQESAIGNRRSRIGNREWYGSVQQSSDRARRRGAGRWEHRPPRPVRLVSSSSPTDDC